MILIEFLLKRFKIIFSLILLIIAIQIILGKVKWHYSSLYIFLFLYFLLSIRSNYGNFVLKANHSKWIFIVSFLLIISTILFLYAFPTDALPIPTGNSQIGTRIFEIEDRDRKEIYTEDENDQRKIKYQIWYPSEDIKGHEKAKWITEGTLLTRQLAKSMFVPSLMLDQTATIDSNSYINAPISKALENYPVVVISHGWKGFREIHTDFAEELASNGFMVVSIDHSYGSQAVKFENGDVALLEKEALPSFASKSKFNKASNLLGTTYGKDVALVIDDLERQNKEDIDFRNKFDLNSLGVLGHSTGGGGDVYIALSDERIKALMTLDAWLEPLQGEALDQGLSIPSLFLRSEKWTGRPNDTYLNIVLDNSKDANLIQMNETMHVDFAMTYMYSPLTKYIGFTGKSGGREGASAQRELILKFFDEHLRDSEFSKTQSIDDIVDKYDYMEKIK